MNPLKLEPTLAEDLQSVVDAHADLYQHYAGKTVLVTGATGLIGHVLILALLTANELLDVDIHILGVARNPQKADRIFGQLVERDDFELIFQEISAPIQTPQALDFIFHTAAVTTSKLLIEKPVEAYIAQFDGMNNVLKRAQADQARVVYLSSMEIYGQPFVDHRATEADVGYVDPLVVRNGYPESKRSNEFLASAYSHEFGVSVVNARLAQTFGPGVSADDTRVFAQFARSAVAGEPLVLHTDGSSMGNYCYLRDTIAALLLLGVKGRRGESYNVVNEANTVSIKALAELVATHFGTGEVVIDIPDHDMGYAPKVQLRLSGQKLMQLGWQPTADLVQMFTRTLKSWETGKQ